MNRKPSPVAMPRRSPESNRRRLERTLKEMLAKAAMSPNRETDPFSWSSSLPYRRIIE